MFGFYFLITTQANFAQNNTAISIQWDGSDDKCELEVEKRDITREENKFCSYVIQLEINSTQTLNAVFSSQPNMIITPAAFTITPGVTTYTFTIVPLGNYQGGDVEFLLTGTDAEGRVCLYDFKLFIPSCVENNTTEKLVETQKDNYNYIQSKVAFTPNPTTGILYFDFENVKMNSQLYLFDLTGRLIYSKEIKEEKGHYTIDMNALPSGIYVAVIKNNGQIVSQHKVVKQ
ncbi:T9SS type A sorting domain-containing protein [Flavobacterium filum]|uniref:T9SS type A sorting domain-containing protein n=1 Tax=Flavobacterium filum TaxID=370974 RepID=UPI00040CC24A|nr:T9SS type A sorting domain-containing protein [Flavobacterium filum]